MSSPDLNALVEGLTRLSEVYGEDDPMVQALVATSLDFVQTCNGTCCNHDVKALRSLLD
mgnify:CR=1 FL=1